MNHTRNQHHVGLPARLAPVFLLFLILCSLPCAAATLDLAPGWNLIAATRDFADSAPDTLELFEFSEGIYSLVTAEQVVPGRGYWVYSESTQTLNIADSVISTGIVSVALSPGWNLVGNPYPNPALPSQNVTVSLNGTITNFSDSDAVEPHFITYDPGTSNYAKLAAGAGLEPFRGYLVRAKKPCTLMIHQPGLPDSPAAQRLWVRPFQDNEISTDPETGNRIAGREVIVQVPAGASLIDAESQIVNLGGVVEGRIPGLNLLQVVIPGNVQPPEFGALIESGISSAEAAVNPIFEMAEFPNDPVFSDSDEINDYQFAAINAFDAFHSVSAAMTANTGPILAILDTGIDSAHEEFQGRVMAGYDFTADSAETTDRNGHGTQVAGLAAAAGNNGTGTAGMCWTCRLMPVKVLDDHGRTTAFTVLAGIFYAADNGAQVINVSISGLNDHGFWEKEFAKAAAYARSKGAVVVAAAGNNSADATDYLPGAAAGMLTVGATDSSDARATFSNYGVAIQFAAPGSQLFTTTLSGYTWMSGTSAAAPLVAGAAAALYLAHPGWTPDQVRAALISTARPVATDQPLGAGIIDLSAAAAWSGPGTSDGSTGNGSGGSAGNGSGPGMGATAVCQVTSSADSGSNTLRNCILSANVDTGANQILFNLPLNSTIFLQSELPPLVDNAGVEIDGSGTQVIINGANPNVRNKDGLRILSSNNTIRGISFVKFQTDDTNPDAGKGVAIRITDKDDNGNPLAVAPQDNQILNCRIGTNFNDTLDMGNAMGILFEGKVHNNIVQDTWITRNFGHGIVIQNGGNLSGGNEITIRDSRISLNNGNGIVIKNLSNVNSVINSQIYGNKFNGILIHDSRVNSIYGNFIGGKMVGMELLDNEMNGISITGDSSDANQIGGIITSGLGNVISGNALNGIYIDAGDNNMIYGNIIGLESDGATTLANTYNGIQLTNSAIANQIGRSEDTYRNIISGNAQHGILIEGSLTTGTIVLNNYIGLTRDGYSARPNKGLAGIYIDKSPQNAIGVGSGDTPGGNVIAGNTYSGIVIDSANSNLVQYNRIGIDPLGNYVGNSSHGVRIKNASFNVVGAKQADKGGENIIANNGRNAISVYGSSSIGNKIFKNSVYDNSKLGIDLNEDGVTLNGGSSVGANNNLNYPVISNVQFTGIAGGKYCYTVTGSKAANTYAHVYFADDRSINVKPDTLGYGEGYAYVGESPALYSATSFSYPNICISACRAFSAIALDAGGNTSEFSKNFDVCTGPEISNITFTPDTVVDNNMQKVRLTLTITYSNGLHLITSVKADLSAVGRSSTTDLYDDGNHGDGAAGDGVYGTQYFTVPEGVSGGAKNIPIAVSYTLGSPVSAAGVLTVRNLAKPQACGNDWPSFACNNANTGQSTQSFKWPLKIKWKNDTDFNSVIYTSPVISGNHIYVAEKNGYAYALDKNNGQKIWKSVYLGDTFQDNAPAIWNDWVIFAGESGKIHALDRFNNGIVQWQPGLIGGNIAGSSPVVDNDLIYVGAKDGKVYALNPISKTVEWSYPPSSSSVYSFAESPVSVVNGIVYAGNKKCVVYALDAFTGLEYWHKQLSTDISCQINGAGVTVTGDSVCTATYGTNMVYCLNKYSGNIQWSQPSPQSIMDSHGAIYSNQYVIGTYSSTGIGTLYAYDIVNNGNILWHATLGENLNHSSPAVFNNYIYVTTGNNATAQGGLYVVDPNQIDSKQEAAVVWRNDVQSFIVSNPAITDDLIVFGTAFSTPHTLYGFEPGSLYQCPDWTVKNNNPSGAGSLYDCVNLANETIEPNTISFDPLVHDTIIKPEHPLIFAQAGGSITLDGTGRNIVISGQNCPNCNGFEIAAHGSKIKGLAVVKYVNHHGIDISAQNVTIFGCRVGTDFSDSPGSGNKGGIYISGQSNSVMNSVVSGNSGIGITLDGSDAMLNAIQANKIGTSTNGMNSLPNAQGGILVLSGASNNLIGGQWSVNQGNVISGNAQFGIKITGVDSDNNAVQGNIIGLNADQSDKLPNTNAIMIMSGPDQTEIGGGLDYSNVISGNTNLSLYIQSAINNTIQGNRIGFARNAATPFGNGNIGIVLNEAHNSLVGGTDPGDANYIGNNAADGIYVINTNTLTLLNNRVGINASLQAAGNTGDGIHIHSNVSHITAGDTAGHANIIAYNGGDGIDVLNLPTDVTLSGNRIFENTGKGIVSALDYQLKITAISKSGSNYNISGTSTCAGCVVELFRVDDSDALVGQDNATSPRAGEAFEFASYTTTLGSGNWSFSNLPVSSKSKYVTAAITDANGSTTEFTVNFELPQTNCPLWTVTTTADSGYGSLRECIKEANNAGGDQTITFANGIQNGVIKPITELPVISQPNITVDGGSQNITLDGSFPCPNCHGLVLQNSGGGVKHLTIINFNTNDRSGIVIDGQTGKGDNYVISGNRIGTDGASSKPNMFGISIVLGGDHNTIEGNIISGNTKHGINIIGAGSNYNSVFNNFIGFADDGTSPIPNLNSGIHIGNQASYNKIGGADPGQPNRIGNNGARGIHVDFGTCARNTFSQNAIYNNTRLGIELISGANGGVAPPVITQATAAAPNQYKISGITSPPCTTCTVELFLADYTGTPAVPQEDFSAPPAGEAYSYLATAVTDAITGAWTLPAPLTITDGKHVTATLTDNNANTSMFAQNVELPDLLCPGLIVTSDQDSGAGSLRECIKFANTDGVESDITFSITNKTITLNSALPPLTENRTTIKNTTGTRIAIDGGENGFGCFSIQSSGNQIRGLTIVNCGGATSGHAIEITGGDANFNTVAGNFIGTDASGATGLGNHTGILIQNSANFNSIGGTNAADRNVISANTSYGIRITGTGSSNNAVYGNYLGSGANGLKAAGLQNGTAISIESAASHNKIGGYDPGQPNLIINSSANGVQITGSGTSGNKAIGNRIYENGGLGISLSAGGNNSLATPQIATASRASFTTYNISGTTAPACSGCTIELYRADDTATSVLHDAAGGEGFQSVATATTSVSGTWSFHGLAISGGNYVSATVTDGSGNTSPFAIDKKLPSSNCPGLVVTTESESAFGSLRECIIAANTDNTNSDITFDSSLAGKTILLTQSLPTIQQNPNTASSYTTIQNTTGGSVTIDGGQGNFGCINIASSNNQIRGLTIVNCGSGLNGHGIGIAGAANKNNVIAGNIIGTNASSAANLGNSIGIRIDSASHNTIGGTTNADRNVISGNIVGLNLNFSAHDNLVAGNYFGTNPAGTGPVANAYPVSAGIVISNSAYHNTIGGDTDAKRNIISGTSYGIIIQHSGSDDNTITGNFIGSDKNGNDAADLQNGTGVKIESGAKSNTIGGENSGQANLIVFSSDNGIIVKEAGTTDNTISRNRIFQSGGKGIQLESGGNTSIAPPRINAVSVTAPQTYTIAGDTSPVCANCTVELFRADYSGAPSIAPDAAGEAHAFVFATSTDINGKWMIAGKSIPDGQYVTTTLTDAGGNTSEFSLNKLLNGDPVITSLTSTSQDISFYDVITLAASAADPDGDPLTYEWSGGDPNPFTATTSASTHWTAPRDAYIATMTVTVRDNKGGLASASISVRVGIKDIRYIVVHPLTLRIPVNGSHKYSIQALFSTGDAFDIHAESATVSGGKGAVDVYGNFTATAAGDDMVVFNIGDHQDSCPVTIY